MYIKNNLYDLLTPFVDNIRYLKKYIVAITDVKLNSQDVSIGDLFAAIRGCKTDGKLYIKDALKKGASVVLLELQDDATFELQKWWYICNFKEVPLVYIKNLRRHLSGIAGRFYNHPSRFLNLVGVTGTNGKTTVTHLLTHWVQLLGEKSAVMGTVGNGSLDKLNVSCNTTCSAFDIQKMLFQWLQHKIKFVAMEVSSHGLAQYRADALYFNVAVFTNLSHDHLDYHGNVMQYIMSKRRLFSELYVKKYVINIDDPIGYQWISQLPQAIAVTTKKINLPYIWKGQWICVVQVSYNLYGTNIVFDSSWGGGVIYSQLLGEFNVSNILLALATLLILGYPLSLLLSTSSQLSSVCGRMEVFRMGLNKPTVIVDYAHTPDALERVCILIRRYCRGQLWCIFGCGGDRDHNKRALMGSIAEQYADHVVITNDNPRTEDPELIISDIIRGVTCFKKIKIVKDRDQAIQNVIMAARSKDIVLVAGKGHEKYQIIGNNYVYHSDQEIVKKILG